MGKSKDARRALEDGSEENLPKEGSQHVTEMTQEQGTLRASDSVRMMHSGRGVARAHSKDQMLPITTKT